MKLIFLTPEHAWVILNRDKLMPYLSWNIGKFDRLVQNPARFNPKFVD